MLKKFCLWLLPSLLCLSLGLADTLASGSPDGAELGVESLAFLEGLVENASAEKGPAVQAEIEHFLGACAQPSVKGKLYALEGKLQGKLGEYREAALTFLKAKIVYNDNSSESHALFAKALGAKQGLLRKAAFTDEQIRFLAKTYDQVVDTNSSFEERALLFLRALRAIAEPNLTEELVKELDWYLSLGFGRASEDSCRFWLAQGLSKLGKHYRAWESYYSIVKLYPQSPLTPSSYLFAADELSQKPIWDFAGAVTLLSEYLRKFPERQDRGAVFWKISELCVTRLKDASKARGFVDSLLVRYPRNLEDPGIVYRLGQLFIKKREYDNAERYIARYLKIAPSGEHAKDAKKLLRRIKVEKARP